jgi:hypothetical protein
VPDLNLQLQNYAGKVKALAIVWFIYAAFSLHTGIAGSVFLKAFFSGHFGHWANNPMPMWLGPALLHFLWIFIALRAALALAAGWGLYERAQWGRIVAIVAAVLSLLRFPIGTALGIWTLIVLLGRRYSALYDQL